MSSRRQAEARARAKIVWKRRALSAGLFLVVVFLVRAAWDVYGKERDAAQNMVHGQMELADSVARKEALERNIARLETEEGLEEAMRQQFQMGRPGEGMVVVVDPKEPAATKTAPRAGLAGFWAWLTDRQ